MSIPFDFDQEDWGAQRVFADGELEGLWVPDKYVIHYGGNANFAGDAERAFLKGYHPWPSIEAEMAVLRIYEQSHLSRGWRAIGYNWAVGQSGKVYRLRGENPSGATSGDYEPDGIRENAEAKAILWIGGLGQEPTQAAKDSISRIILTDAVSKVVIGHREVKKGSTNCPGDPLQKWIDAEGWDKETDMIGIDTFVKYIRREDIVKMGADGIITPREVEYFTEEDPWPAGGDKVLNHPDWENLYFAWAVRSPIWAV